jgi:hypothetical protein
LEEGELGLTPLQHYCSILSNMHTRDAGATFLHFIMLKM